MEKTSVRRSKTLKVSGWITGLAVAPVQDELELRRLKKQKLLLKDQISLLERRLIPDVPA